MPGLAWLLREDYLAVGFLLAPPTDPEDRRRSRHLIFKYDSAIPRQLLIPEHPPPISPA